MRKLKVEEGANGALTLHFFDDEAGPTSAPSAVSFHTSVSNFQAALEQYHNGFGKISKHSVQVAPSGPAQGKKSIFFRNKPKVVQAHQYTEYGKLVQGMCNSQTCYVAGNTRPHVHTIHDDQMVLLEVGDFILPEPDGMHFYPVKPEIFHATYEPI